MMNEEKKIDCIILCGGKGRRLGSRGEKTNKTMIKIQGYPLIHYLINYLKQNNINNIILPLGFKGSSIKRYLIKTFNKDLDTTIVTNPKNWYYTDILSEGCALKPR